MELSRVYFRQRCPISKPKIKCDTHIIIKKLKTKKILKYLNTKNKKPESKLKLNMRAVIKSLQHK